MDQKPACLFATAGQNLSFDAIAVNEEACSQRLDFFAQGRDFTAIACRPFDRRRAKTARPPLVRMRARKPWTFARRSFFGWYVRFVDIIAGSLAK